MTLSDAKLYKILSIIFLIIVLGFGFYVVHENKGTSLAIVGLVMVIVGMLPITVLMLCYWRCPKCHKNLGRDFTRHCSSCGVEIKDDDQL